MAALRGDISFRYLKQFFLVDNVTVRWIIAIVMLFLYFDM